MEHFKPFNIEHAKAGAPCKCYDGTFTEIIYWTALTQNFPIVALLGKEQSLMRYREDGTSSFPTSSYLVMTPIAFIEKKPVYWDDKIVTQFGITIQAHIWFSQKESFEFCTWPVTYPKSQISDDELYEIWVASPLLTDSLRAVADAVLRHAIKSGQVIFK